MKPKFSIGQNVVVVRSVTFMFDHHVIRPGEIGKVIEYDYFILAPDLPLMIDYIVSIGGRTLFFYEDELAAYPKTED